MSETAKDGALVGPGRRQTLGRCEIPRRPFSLVDQRLEHSCCLLLFFLNDGVGTDGEGDDEAHADER